MKKALIISLALNIIILLVFAGKRYYYSYGSGAGPGKSAIESYDQWNKMQSSVFAELPIDTSSIVFVGNSLTEGFPVTELYGSKYKNRGISGNRTSHILNRIQLIAVKQPKKIFLEGGINDLKDSLSIDSIYDNYRAIIMAIIRISPKTKIYVQSCFPTSEEYAKLNTAVILLNSKLNNYCKEQGIIYIDIYTSMVKNGLLNSDYTEDGIHLNSKGYQIWEKAIEEYL